MLVEGGRVSLDDPWHLTGQTAKELPVHPLEQPPQRRHILRPRRSEHKGLYAHLERLIACSIPSWNEILFHGEARGRHPPRILTYSCRIETYQEEHKVFERLWPMLHWTHLYHYEQEWQEKCGQVREYVSGPEPPVWKQARRLRCMPANLLEILTTKDWEDPRKFNEIARYKRRRRAWFDHPEPIGYLCDIQYLHYNADL